MRRYARITDKIPREIVLLKGRPCIWSRCTFCDYIDDNTTDEALIRSVAERELAKVTGDDAWNAWVMRGAKGLLDQGIPENRPEGYWNNVSQCCGDAGVGDFFLTLAETTGDPAHGDFARHLGDYIMTEAAQDESGVGWVQAENRTQPDFVQAQTGWMQGAAGGGAFFLHLDGAAKGRAPRVRFPDTPW